jgi:hypothetical protein
MERQIADYLREAFAAEHFSNWVLAALGVVGFFVAKRSLNLLAEQTTATTLAAEAADRSAVIADRTLRGLNQQWLDTDSWRGRVKEYENAPATVDVDFEITNPTPMAVTVQTITAEFMGLGSRLESRQGSLEVLPPRHNRSFSAPLFQLDNLAHWTEAKNNKLRLSVIVEVTYLDAFDQSRLQRFGRTCVGGVDGFTFYKFDGNLAQQKPTLNDRVEP